MRLAFIITLALGGCYDTQDELDDYIERSEPFRIEPGAVPCEEPFDVSGHYVFGVATSLDRTKPLRFDAVYDVDTTVEPWTITITSQAMAVADGALVGEVKIATGEVASNGTFRVDFGEITVPIPANPILPAEAKATLVLEGCTRAETFVCGIVEGKLTAPVEVPLAGSTWGLVPIPADVDPATLLLVTQCPE